MGGLDPQETARRFVAAWNAETDEERADHVAAATTEGVVYLDPHAPAPVTGRAGIADLVRFFRTRFDHALVIDGPVDAHNGFVRYRWRLERPDGDQLSRGATFGELDPETGRLARIVQFVDAG